MGGDKRRPEEEEKQKDSCSIMQGRHFHKQFPLFFISAFMADSVICVIRNFILFRSSGKTKYNSAIQ